VDLADPQPHAHTAQVVKPAHPDHPDPLETQAVMDSQEHQGKDQAQVPQDPLDHPDPLAEMVNPEAMDSPETQELMALAQVESPVQRDQVATQEAQDNQVDLDTQADQEVQAPLDPLAHPEIQEDPVVMDIQANREAVALQEAMPRTALAPDELGLAVLTHLLESPTLEPLTLVYLVATLLAATLEATRPLRPLLRQQLRLRSINNAQIWKRIILPNLSILETSSLPHLLLLIVYLSKSIGWRESDYQLVK